MGALLYEFNEFGQMPKLESQGVVSDPEQDGDITGRLNGGLIRMGMGTPPANLGVDPDRAALNQETRDDDPA